MPDPTAPTYRVIATGQIVRLVCTPDGDLRALAHFCLVADPDVSVWALMRDVERVTASGRGMSVPS